MSQVIQTSGTTQISIHALREEGDQDGSWSSHSEA